MSDLQGNTILLLLCSLLFAFIALPLAATSRLQESSQNHNKAFANWAIFAKYVHVTLNNGLGEGLNLTVHCESEVDHDSTATTLIPDGQSFEWRFKPNFWGSTEWFCNFMWRDAIGTYQIYIYKRDHHLCGKHCSWDINQKGLYGPGPDESRIFFTWPGA